MGQGEVYERMIDTSLLIDGVGATCLNGWKTSDQVDWRILFADPLAMSLIEAVFQGSGTSAVDKALQD